jgi:uncharacterized protein YjbI with pentapeptide repeats
MADPKHLAKLMEGTRAWNRWRKAHPIITPNLMEAKLSGGNLNRANLMRADLRMADMREVDLEYGNVFGSDLSRADLSNAKLMGLDASNARLVKAVLTQANLSKSNLSSANLSQSLLRDAILIEADLSGASLTMADLSDANFSGANLSKADLSGANLSAAKLSAANLFMSNLSRAKLLGADLTEADLSRAILRGARLAGADLRLADLSEADLREADLTGALLQQARLVGTNLEGATLASCSVYGISTWDVRLDGSIQSNLVVTPEHQPAIQVDNLEVAQFIYLLLNNEKIRNVIETITSKVVLILGSFKGERKVILDAIRDDLRKRDYLPVLFDFEKPSSRDITETVSTLAHIARFVIADITDARSIPQELMAIVPRLPSVPVQPLLLASQGQYGMFEHFASFPWVLEPVLYENQESLLAELDEKVICPAEKKAKAQISK